MISFNMWIQRGDWGATETGCQVELAFYEWDEEDGYGSGQEGQLVTLPEEPGQTEEPEPDFEIYGEGETAVTVGNCSTPVGGVRWAVLGLVGTLLLRRRHRQ